MTSFLRTRKDRHPKPENKTRLHTTYADVLPEVYTQLPIEKSAFESDEKFIEAAQYGDKKLEEHPATRNKKQQQVTRKTSIVS